VAFRKVASVSAPKGLIRRAVTPATEGQSARGVPANVISLYLQPALVAGRTHNQNELVGFSNVLDRYRLNKDFLKEILSTVSSMKVRFWISCKAFHGKLSQEELDLYLLLLQEDLESFFYRTYRSGVLLHSVCNRKGFQSLYNRIKEQLLDDTRRVYRSYTPKWKYNQRFVPLKLPPKRFVGIGYSDHGTLGTGPSWQSQGVDFLSEPEESGFSRLDDIYAGILRRLLLLQELGLPDESQK